MHLYIGLDALQTRRPNFRKQTLTTVINSFWRQISLQQCILFQASEFQHKRSCASNHILKDGPDLVKRKPTGLPSRETLRTLSHAREGPASWRAQREGFPEFCFRWESNSRPVGAWCYQAGPANSAARPFTVKPSLAIARWIWTPTHRYGGEGRQNSSSTILRSEIWLKIWNFRSFLSK